MFFWEHANYSIGNVSIVSYIWAQIINYTNKLTKLTLMPIWCLVFDDEVNLVGALSRHNLSG